MQVDVILEPSLANFLIEFDYMCLAQVDTGAKKPVHFQKLAISKNTSFSNFHETILESMLPFLHQTSIFFLTPIAFVFGYNFGCYL